MEETDPFAAMKNPYGSSDSQEQLLNHCPFAMESQMNDDDSLYFDAEIPVASTAITMVSPPHTPEDTHKDDQIDNSTLQNDDVYVTPPEEAPSLASSQNQHDQQQVAIDHAKEDQRVDTPELDETVAVDGGDCEESSREEGLGFTVEAELTERIEIEDDLGGALDDSKDKEVIQCGYTNGMVLKRELPCSSPPNNVIGESSTKRLKLYDSNLSLVTPKPSLKTGIGKTLETLVKSLDRFKWTPRATVGAESVKCDERLVKSVDVITAESKRAKLLNKNPDLGSPRSSLVSETERRLSSEGESGRSCGLKSPRNEQVGEAEIETNSSDIECNVESSAKRKLAFSTEVMESVDKLDSEGGSSSNCGLKSPQNEQVGEMVIEVNSSDRERGRESSANRKSAVSTEVMESAERLGHEGGSSSKCGLKSPQNEFEGNDAALRFVNDGVEERETNRLCETRKEHSARKSIDDLDKFRYVGPNAGTNACCKDDVQEKRVLPASVQVREDNAGAGEAGHDTGKDHQITLLDVLKILAEEEHYDPRLENLSILEAARIGGMTFP